MWRCLIFLLSSSHFAFILTAEFNTYYCCFSIFLANLSSFFVSSHVLFNKYINVWHTFTALKYFAVAFRYFRSRHHREFRFKCRFLLYGSANSWKTFVLLVAFKQSAHLSVSLYFSHFLFTIKIVVVIFIFLQFLLLHRIHVSATYNLKKNCVKLFK